MKNVIGFLVTLLVILSILLMVTHSFLILIGVLPLIKYQFIGLLLFNLFTYIWYAEFYKRK